MLNRLQIDRGVYAKEIFYTGNSIEMFKKFVECIELGRSKVIMKHFKRNISITVLAFAATFAIGFSGAAIGTNDGTSNSTKSGSAVSFKVSERPFQNRSIAYRNGIGAISRNLLW